MIVKSIHSSLRSESKTPSIFQKHGKKIKNGNFYAKSILVFTFFVTLKQMTEDTYNIFNVYIYYYFLYTVGSQPVPREMSDICDYAGKKILKIVFYFITFIFEKYNNIIIF